MQHCAQRLGHCAIDRREPGGLLRGDVGHGVRRHDAADEGVDAGGRRGRRRRQARRLATQQLRQQAIIVVHCGAGLMWPGRRRGRRPGTLLQLGYRLRKLGRVQQAPAQIAQRCKRRQVAHQGIGMKVVQRRWRQRAGRQIQLRGQALHHRVERVEIDPVRGPAGQCGLLTGRQGAEVAHHQQAHGPRTRWPLGPPIGDARGAAAA